MPMILLFKGVILILLDVYVSSISITFGDLQELRFTSNISTKNIIKDSVSSSKRGGP